MDSEGKRSYMKLIMMKGLPASGKSTAAKELVKDNLGNYKRINRDDLRAMIDNGKWSKHNEKSIIGAEKVLAGMYLRTGYNVIIDDCNLSQKNYELWFNFASEIGATFEVVDFTHIPIDECIKRDQKRPNYVGEKVIKKMYNEFLAVPTPIIPKVLDRQLPPAFIFDMDGTLAIHDGRSPYDYPKLESDIVNESVRTILNLVPQPRAVFIVSGRPDTYREATERWLKTNEIEYTALYMRKGDDSRNDTIIKREIYQEHIEGKYHVMAWFDDRLRVCREIHRLGLPLFKCGDPDSDF